MLRRMIAHPSYPNPTIIEALCEVHFRLPEGEEWKPALPGELFKRIQNEYPQMEPAAEVGLQVELSQRGLGQKVLPPRSRTRFRHKSQPLLFQFAENIMTLNFFPPYPGWAAMSQHVLWAWEQVRELLRPASIRRVGVRYINRIERESPLETPGDWLLPGEYIPPGVLRAGLGSFLRVEAHLDAWHRIIITLGNTTRQKEAGAADNANDPPAAIIFDIDRFIEQELQPESAVFSRQLSALHEHVFETFVAARSERLERLLKKEKRPSA